MHAPNLAVLVEDRDVEPDHNQFAAVRGSGMPAEASLVMVRVGRPGQAGASSREAVPHSADRSVDLVVPVGVGERVGVTAVRRPQRVDEPVALPGSVSFQTAM